MGFDTPEIRRTKCGEYERRRGRAAHDFVRGVIGERVWLVNVTHDKFGRRFVASALLADGSDLATLLLATQPCLLYRGGRRPKWC